jgi:hypothetical protein
VKTLVVSIAFVAFVALSTLALITSMVFGGASTASIHPSVAPNIDSPVEPVVGWDAKSGSPHDRSVAHAPQPTPLPTARAVEPTPTVSVVATRQVAVLPTAKPSATIELSSSKLAYEARPGCDPAYPDERTCIPPGPPFKQGCKITDQRLFTVLPPDPQHLDSDGDGIGCEPIKPK